MELRGSNPFTPHAVEVRTSLHFLTPQNGHFLGKRERLFGQLGNSGSNPGISETEERAKSPVFAGFLTHSAKDNWETGLVGWSKRIRTHAFLIEPGLHDDDR